MGHRGQIEIRQPSDETISIYLYTHWDGEKIASLLANSLDKGQDRWNRSDYMTRIIMNGLQEDDREITGFGIGIERHMDCDDQNVVVYWEHIARYPARSKSTQNWLDGDGSLFVDYRNRTYTAAQFVNDFATKVLS